MEYKENTTQPLNHTTESLSLLSQNHKIIIAITDAAINSYCTNFY